MFKKTQGCLELYPELVAREICNADSKCNLEDMDMSDKRTLPANAHETMEYLAKIWGMRAAFLEYYKQDNFDKIVIPTPNES